MLDAQPAANAPARPPAIQPLHPSPVIADTPGVRSKPAALLAAATALLPNLEVGRALDPKTLREAMSAAFGANDAQGAWVWKDAYEAAEAAMVLFIQRYGRLMRREAGAGPGSAAAMLAIDARREVTLLPSPHRRLALADPAHDFHGPQTFPGQKHDPRAPDMLLRRIPVRNQPLEPASVARRYPNTGVCPHAPRIAYQNQIGNLLNATEH